MILRNLRKNIAVLNKVGSFHITETEGKTMIQR